MNTTSVASKPTSLKLPRVIKMQLEEDAQKAGLSLHAYVVQTLADSVRRTRLSEAFTQDAMKALSDMKASELGYELGHVRAYFLDLANYRKGLQVRPQDLAPTRLG